MKVSEAVGRSLTALGVDHVFGVAGSGNFEVTTALVAGGASYTAARHECGAAMMACGYSSITGRVSVASVHQGGGFTNALTGVIEAAKSHTPVLVLAAEMPPAQRTSNFWVEQGPAARALGIHVERIESSETAVSDTVRAFQRAAAGNTVLLCLPLDVQEEEIPWSGDQVVLRPSPRASCASDPDVSGLARMLAGAERPVLVAGRGARAARAEIEALAEASGALLATSAAVRGLFAGNPWSLDVMGGFSTPAAAGLIDGADLIVAFGAGLNRWTTRNGDLVQRANLAQVDADPTAIGRHRPVDVGVVGDCGLVATALIQACARLEPARYRTPDVAERLRSGVRWRDVAFEDASSEQEIDPRSLTIMLDEILPTERIVIADGGSFTEYPAMYLGVPDDRGYCLPLAFQSIGLALAAGIGAARARPDRTTVVGVGDGGFMMSLVELDTAVREQIPLVVVVYDDHAYGAEVHHFAAGGGSVEIARFPDTDLAAIASGFGCSALTVRSAADLDYVREWLTAPRTVPLVIDAKICAFPSWVDGHAFREEQS